MFVTGPDVVKTVTQEVVTQEQLGGAVTHTTKSSVADNAYENDVEALVQVRRLIGFLPLSNREGAAGARKLRSDRAPGSFARHAGAAEPEQALRHEGADPEGRRRWRLLRDPAELSPRTSSPALPVSAATVGFVANQPMVLAGCLDIDSSRKAARFRALLRLL
jgi:propionyl-CoA carboxylase beta chain